MQIRFWTAILMAIFWMAAAAPGQTTWYVDDDAPNDPAPGDPTISDPDENGSADHPFDAIQEGIDAAVADDEVVVLDGLYKGTGNRDLDFGGKAITVRSDSADPTTCIIDCEGVVRGFYFHSGEEPDSIVEGLTVTDGAYGAIWCYASSSPTISNCTLADNTAHFGAALACNSDLPLFSDVTMLHCILWNGGDEIWNNDGATLTLTYCDVQGGWTGAGNIDADPLFLDLANDDYHLAADSPCIDAGDPAFVPAPGETDMDGEMRVWDRDDVPGARVDMGADEFGSFQYGDLDCDAVVNGFDIDAFVLALKGPAYYDPVYPDCDLVLADINADGVVNGFDIDPFIALLIGEQ
ncbi:MAG: right-handed parallel beta-helix repeat-containing protein [Planctomycetes bacterium]|nr:right-handed parallel beta-helix repeat-containing protein [Planctomycetota bacterium]